MSTDLVIARLSTARNALVEAKTAAEVKAVMDAAAAAETFAKRQKLSEETIHYATALKLDAERKLGEILREAPKATGGEHGGRRPLDGARAEPSNPTPTLRDLGIDKKTSARAQRLAALPEETFEAVKAGEVKVNEALRGKRREDLKERTAALPPDRYRIVYADPPWAYGDERTGLQGYTAAETHYPTMKLPELCALDVRSLAADDSVLFMWATFPLLPDALDVMKAWGFTYKQAFVWDKVRRNFGNYHAANAEILMIGTRGSGTPEVRIEHDQVQVIEKTAKHSEKPEEFRAIIDSLYPTGNRIELFRRGVAPAGWTVWGNEAVAA